jgi:hypothetical protein
VTEPVRQIGLTTDSPGVSFDALEQVARALDAQVNRDLGPIWNVQAAVHAFPDPGAVPPDHWPLVVVEKLDAGAGLHRDSGGRPNALIKLRPLWSLTASHECLEMLVNPLGDRVIIGPSPEDPGDQVELLVEVCDPVQAVTFGYRIGNVLVSDFVTPSYFDFPPGFIARYSYRGSVTTPRQVPLGGCLTWFEPRTQRWSQKTYQGINRLA